MTFYHLDGMQTAHKQLLANGSVYIWLSAASKKQDSVHTFVAINKLAKFNQHKENTKRLRPAVSTPAHACFYRSKAHLRSVSQSAVNFSVSILVFNYNI